MCSLHLHLIVCLLQDGAIKKRSVHVKDVVPECEYEVADYPEERYGDARDYLQVSLCVRVVRCGDVTDGRRHRFIRRLMSL